MSIPSETSILLYCSILITQPINSLILAKPHKESFTQTYLDKKSHRNMDICYIGYITIKKFSDCENTHSVNPLYLIIHSATGYLNEKNGEKYLIINSTEKLKKFFSGIKLEIETLNGRKELLGFQINPLSHTPLSINSLHPHIHLSLFLRCLLLQTI